MARIAAAVLTLAVVGLVYLARVGWLAPVLLAMLGLVLLTSIGRRQRRKDTP